MSFLKKVGKMSLSIPITHGEYSNDDPYKEPGACLAVNPERYHMYVDDFDDIPSGPFHDGQEFWFLFDPRCWRTSEVEEMMLEAADAAERLCDAYREGDNAKIKKAIAEIEKYGLKNADSDDEHFDFGEYVWDYEEAPTSFYVVEDDRCFKGQPVMFASKEAFENWRWYDEWKIPHLDDIEGFTITLRVDARDDAYDSNNPILYSDETGERWFAFDEHEMFDGADNRGLRIDKLEIDATDAIERCMDYNISSLPEDAERDFYVNSP